MADYNQMMQDPRMSQLVQQMARKRKKPTLTDLLNGKGSHSDLAQAFPKLDSMMQQQKLADAKKKVQDLAFKQLHDRAKKAYDLMQKQRELMQGQQQIQAARNSV
jgi:hypothetical protein